MSTSTKQVKTAAELRAELAEATRAKRMGELKNTAQLRQLRVSIAQALTAERLAASASAATPAKAEKEEEN